MSKLAKNVVIGSFQMFTGKALATLIGLLNSIIVARLLGPYWFGVYSLILLIPSLMLLFADFGLSSALVRFIAKFNADGSYKSIKSFTKTGVIFTLLTSTLLLTLLFPFADVIASYLLNRPDTGFFIRLASLTIIGNMLTLIYSSIFVGLDRMGKSAVVLTVQAGGRAFFESTLIISGFGIVGAIIGYALSYAIASLIGTIILIKELRYLKDANGNNFDFINDLKSMIKYGAPLYVSNFMGNLLIQYESLMLAWFTSNIDIGNYSVADKFSMLIILLTYPISTSLFAAFSKLNPLTQKQEMKTFFKDFLKYTLLLVIPLSIFVYLNSYGLITLFFGIGYAQAPLYLALYSITFLHMGFSSVLASVFNGMGRTDMVLKATFIQLLSVVLIGTPLAYLLKVPGLLYTLIISGTLALVYLAYIAYRKYELEFDLKCVVKIFVAGIISSIPTLVFNIYLQNSYLVKIILSLGSFTLGYLTLVPIIGALTHYDIRNLIALTENTPLQFFFQKILSYEEKVLSIKNKI